MNVYGPKKEATPCVEPSLSVEGYWTVVRGSEVLLITPHLEEAREACRRLLAAAEEPAS